MPQPISNTVSVVLKSKLATIRRITVRSWRKFWPSLFLATIGCRATMLSVRMDELLLKNERGFAQCQDRSGFLLHQKINFDTLPRCFGRSGPLGPVMRVLYVASEAVPYAKTGGLADVVGALPKFIRQLGHEAVVLIPKYRGVKSRKVCFPA